MLLHATERARRDGLSELIAYVQPENRVALRFAHAMGFRSIGEDHFCIEVSRQFSSAIPFVLLAREMGLLKVGTVALDGTKIHANASKHSALSYEHAGKIEAQLKAEVAELMAKAEAADKADLPDGLSIPDELARREERLKKLAEARAKIEARAKERYQRELAEHRAKLAAREAKQKVARLARLMSSDGVPIEHWSPLLPRCGSDCAYCE